MPNKLNKYYYIDLRLTDMKIMKWGESNTATLTGDTPDPDVHRIFLTEGQYNKFIKKI